VITTIVNIHAGHGPTPKVDATLDADGFVTLKRTSSSDDAMVAIALVLNGRPETVLHDLDAMRWALIDAVNAARTDELLDDPFAASADAAREDALAKAHEAA
jgi:hypothetical protein